MSDRNPHRVIIIGAGPAGLTAGYELSRGGYRAEILEADSRYVGGLAQTVEYQGFRFDIGGHRFFSKNPEIEALWTELLGPRMRDCARLSRIYYRGRFFKYPIEPLDALLNLGPIEALRSLISYLQVQRHAPTHIRSFEEWVVSAFGRHLYEIFFKTYTEKVWGIPCDQISADWAAQRIRGLSLVSVMRSLLRVPERNGKVIKTLVDHFRYPALGPGEMWQRPPARSKKPAARCGWDSRCEAFIARADVSRRLQLIAVTGRRFIAATALSQQCRSQNS